MVGDVSPKHHVGDSRLKPVFGRKSDFKPFRLATQITVPTQGQIA
jgi:hypothetical protein